MKIVCGTPSQLGADLMTRLARYRHAVFVQRLGWELDCVDDEEYDTFDRPDTRYVVALDQGRVCGAARLLPTMRDYLLSEVFPGLLDGEAPPRSPQVWELSRFAAVDLDAPRDRGAMAHLSSPTAVGLLEHALAVAAGHGVLRLITVSPVGVERLLRRAGFEMRRAGPMRRHGRHALIACLIHCRPLREEYAGTTAVPPAIRTRGALGVASVAPHQAQCHLGA